jgi:hypothetical protein
MGRHKIPSEYQHVMVSVERRYANMAKENRLSFPSFFARLHNKLLEYIAENETLRKEKSLDKSTIKSLQKLIEELEEKKAKR